MKYRLTGLIMAGIIILSMLLVGGAAYASTGIQPSPGITPDSPFYFFDKLGKNFGMAFAFGANAKAKKSLEYANERLAEAQQMASENKTARLEKALADFEKYITMLQAKLAEIKQQVASDNISESAALAAIRHLDVLEWLKAHVPDKDKDYVSHAENVTQDGQLRSLRALGKDKPYRVFDICDNVTNHQFDKVKGKCSGNITTANVTAELDFAQRISDLEDEMTAHAAAFGANVTDLQERLAHSTANRLDVLSRVYEKAPDKAQPAIAHAIENSVTKYEKVTNKLDSKTFASVNETIKKMPVKLQPTLSNRASDVKLNSANPKSSDKH
jgi:hypothetical protein